MDFKGLGTTMVIVSGLLFAAPWALVAMVE